MLQARARDDAKAPRVGFTVTKRVGNAVVRNRIKRRLREAVRLSLFGLARDGVDYVLIGRQGTVHRRFDTLREDLESTKRTMSNMLNEYAQMYQRGDGAAGETTARRILSTEPAAPGDPATSDHGEELETYDGPLESPQPGDGETPDADPPRPGGDAQAA